MSRLTPAAAARALAPLVRDVTDNPRADPRQLKPSQLLQLLNSTPAGDVLTDPKLRRHRQSAGLRIGDGKTIDLIRYAAWLCHERDRTKPAAGPADPYARKRETEAARSRAKAAHGKEIGPPPAIVDPARRAACENDFQRFCRTYAPEKFFLEWGEPHLLAAQRIQTVVTRGGLFALAMPRGWGKTTLCQWGLLWAALYGKRRFGVYVAATDEAATMKLDEIKIELETNELLGEDFPEVCYPIRCLEGITQRGRGQTSNGVRTRITWLDNRIALPTVAGSRASGSIIAARGITSKGLRGLKVTTAEGPVLRPDIAIPDDPQDDESAVSPGQVTKRLKIINGTILRLPGPKRRIACFVPCTVIAEGDVADQLLDNEKNPRWNGQRTVALSTLPTNEKAWEEYANVRAAGLRAKDEGKAANAQFKKHQAILEAGAKHNWPENVEEGDISAIQSVMHVKLDDPATFWAELQQKPLSLQEVADATIERTELAFRITKPGRMIIPQSTQKVTAFIDPNSKVLWWAVCGFGAGFSGHIAGVGTWPDQQLGYFINNDLRRTIAKAKPKAGLQAQIMHALEALTEELLGREWQTEGGVPVKVDRCLVDANWGAITDTVYRFCRASKFSAILRPSHGKFLGPTDKSINEWKAQEGDVIGHHWRERLSAKHAKRFVIFDTNRWKTHTSERLKVAKGDPGALTLYDATQEQHRLLFDHLTSETPVEMAQKNQKLTIWKETKGRDNDFWDCITGCHVAASMIGIDLLPTAGGRPPKKPKPKRANRVSYL